MSVLLRQPHGFEGLGVIPKELVADALSVPERVDERGLQCELGPLPAVRQTALTATRSPESMKSLIGSSVSSSHVSRICQTWRMTASRPT